MRELKIIEHISLDGVIQNSGDDDDFPYDDWTAPYRTPAGRDAIIAAHGERFDLLLGRRTYDTWSGFWPKAPSSPLAGLAPDAYIVETLREHLTQPSNGAVQQHPTAQHLSLTEADLLLKINHSLAGITWSRYHSLIAKRRSETLTSDDQQELITLSDQGHD